MSWEQCFAHGNKMQEYFVKYMEEKYGYEFLAGDRNGITLNIDYIEEVLRCEYVHPVPKKNGPMLRFISPTGDVDEFIMPDELLFSNDKKQFFDVKNRRINNLFEKYGTLFDYYSVSERTGVPVFIGLIVFNFKTNNYDVYVRNVKNILDEYVGKKEKYSKVYFNISKFKKI